MLLTTAFKANKKATNFNIITNFNTHVRHHNKLQMSSYNKSNSVLSMLVIGPVDISIYCQTFSYFLIQNIQQIHRAHFVLVKIIMNYTHNINSGMTSSLLCHDDVNPAEVRTAHTSCSLLASNASKLYGAISIRYKQNGGFCPQKPPT